MLPLAFCWVLFHEFIYLMQTQTLYPFRLEGSHKEFIKSIAHITNTDVANESAVIFFATPPGTKNKTNKQTKKGTPNTQQKKKKKKITSRRQHILGSTSMSRKLQLTLANAILLSIAVLMLLGVVGIKAYRSGVSTRPIVPAKTDSLSRRSQQIPEQSEDVGVELAALRDELKGLKGPIHDLMEALDDLAAEAPQTMPFTRLQYHKSIDRSKTILVVVPDADPANCRQLVNSAFEMAKNKFQIRVGLVELTDEEAPPAAPGADRDVIFHLSKCVDPKYALCNQSKFCPTDFIRIRQIPKQEMSRLNKGHSWLSHIGSMVYRKEQYVLFLDNAAAVFEESWDEKLIADYKTRQTETGSRVALSGRLPDSSVSHFSKVCIDSLDPNGIPIFSTTRRLASDGPVGALQTLVTTEFLFTEGVPFFVHSPLDRYLDKITTSGHDVLLSARLLGLGYSIYLPQNPTVFYRAAAAGEGAALIPRIVTESADTSIASLTSRDSAERFFSAFSEPSKIKDIRFRIAGDGVSLIESGGVKVSSGRIELTGTKDSRCAL